MFGKYINKKAEFQIFFTESEQCKFFCLKGLNIEY